MKPVKFPQQNKTFIAPADMDNCQDLPAHQHQGGILSCWELSDAEFEQLKRTRKIYLNVCGVSQPPVWLSTDPFEEITPECGMPVPPPDPDTQVHDLTCAKIVHGTACDCPALEEFKKRPLN